MKLAGNVLEYGGMVPTRSGCNTLDIGVCNGRRAWVSAAQHRCEVGQRGWEGGAMLHATSSLQLDSVTTTMHSSSPASHSAGAMPSKGLLSALAVCASASRFLPPLVACSLRWSHCDCNHAAAHGVVVLTVAHFLDGCCAMLVTHGLGEHDTMGCCSASSLTTGCAVLSPVGG